MFPLHFNRVARKRKQSRAGSKSRIVGRTGEAAEAAEAADAEDAEDTGFKNMSASY